MKFGDFARNYLNPIYICFRLGLLGAGIGSLLLSSSAATNGKFVLIFFPLGLWLVWTGIRPWGNGRGATMNDLNR